MCKEFNFFQSCYNGSVNDTIYNEGQRSVMIFIIKQLEINPAKLLDEYRVRLKKEQDYEYE